MSETFISQNTIAQEPRLIRRHILDLLLPFVWSLLMLIPISLTFLVLDSFEFLDTGAGLLGIWLFSGLYVMFVISFFMTEWIFWYQDAWIITQDRLIDIQIVSLFNRRMSQISFNQIQDVRVEIQGYLQNIFNYGTVLVQSAGHQSFFQLNAIPNPTKVASEISDMSLQEQGGQDKVHIVHPTQKLGEMLVAQGQITHDDLIKALQQQVATGKRLGQILVEQGKISSQDLVQALAGQYKMPSIDLSRYDIDGQTVRLLPKEIAERYMAVAVDRSPDGVISIAMAQPSAEKITELMSQFDAPLTFLVADEGYIQEIIRGYYG